MPPIAQHCWLTVYEESAEAFGKPLSSGSEAIQDLDSLEQVWHFPEHRSQPIGPYLSNLARVSSELSCKIIQLRLEEAVTPRATSTPAFKHPAPSSNSSPSAKETTLQTQRQKW
jgi:hypothetical protein